MLKKRTDITEEEVLKRVCELNNLTYVPEGKRKPPKYIKLVNDNGRVVRINCQTNKVSKNIMDQLSFFSKSASEIVSQTLINTVDDFPKTFNNVRKKGTRKSVMKRKNKTVMIKSK